MWQKTLLGGAGLACAYSLLSSSPQCPQTRRPSSPARPRLQQRQPNSLFDLALARTLAPLSRIADLHQVYAREETQENALSDMLSHAFDNDKQESAAEFDMNAFTESIARAFDQAPQVPHTPPATGVTSRSASAASAEFRSRTSSRSDSSSPPSSSPTSSTSSPASSKLAWVAAGLGGTLVVLHLLVGPFLLPGLRRLSAPFVAANDTLIGGVARVVRALPGDPKRKLFVDIGSGDGCVVVDVAKRTGITGVGIENKYVSRHMLSVEPCWAVFSLYS
jgi:hypothetical protein